MEPQKLLNLLDEASNSKFVTRKCNTVNDQSNANHDAGNEILCNTEVLKSTLCDFNDAHILVKGNITIAENIVPPVAFKNSAPFINCITKIDETTISKSNWEDPKAIQEIEFVGKLKNIDGVDADGAQSMFVLTILEKKHRNNVKVLTRKCNSLIKDGKLSSLLKKSC